MGPLRAGLRLRRAIELNLGAVRVFGTGAGVPQFEATNDALASGQRDPLAAGAGGDDAVYRQRLRRSVAVVNHHMIEENRRVSHLQHNGVKAVFVAANLDVVVISASVDVRLAQVVNGPLRL